jgi:hypothetical protein
VMTMHRADRAPQQTSSSSVKSLLANVRNDHGAAISQLAD